MEAAIKYNNCINASIFYNRAESHLLIQMFIKPFIEEMQLKKMLNESFVYLSSQRGENVRVSLISKNHLKELGSEFDIKLKSFLNDNQSKDAGGTQIPFHFFMNFPNNSVNYNLYSQELNTSSADKRKSTCILRIITRMILDQLSDEHMDLASLFTAITYLQLSLLKSYKVNLSEAASTANIILNDIEKKRNLQLVNAGESTFESTSIFFTNKEIFQEIREDIWSLTTKEFNNSYDWSGISKYFTEKPSSFAKRFLDINRFIFFYLNVPAYIQNEITSHILKNSFKFS